MADFYSNENIPLQVVQELRALGHSVLTSYEAGQANQQVPDEDVIEFAAQAGRILLTHNHKDFKELHQTGTSHNGVISCTVDTDFKGLAERIDRSVVGIGNPGQVMVRVTKGGHTVI